MAPQVDKNKLKELFAKAEGSDKERAAEAEIELMKVWKWPLFWMRCCACWMTYFCLCTLCTSCCCAMYCIGKQVLSMEQLSKPWAEKYPLIALYMRAQDEAMRTMIAEPSAEAIARRKAEINGPEKPAQEVMEGPRDPGQAADVPGQMNEEVKQPAPAADATLTIEELKKEELKAEELKIEKIEAATAAVAAEPGAGEP